MDFSASLASHLMLDPTSNPTYPNPGFQKHRRQSSTASTASYSSSSYDGNAYPIDGSPQAQPQEGDASVQYGSPDLRISTRTSARLHKPSAAPVQSFPLGRPPQHNPAQLQQTQFFGHARAASIDSDSSSPADLHPTYGASPSSNSGCTSSGGAFKRTTTTRRARADTSPYPQQPPQAGVYTLESGGQAGDDLAEYLGGGGARYPHPGSQPSSESGDWSDTPSRRSSMSSTGWSAYDPMDLSTPGSLYSESGANGGSFLDPSNVLSQGGAQLGHIGIVNGSGGIMDSGGSSPDEVRMALEKYADTVKSALTSSAQDRARGAFVQAWLGLSYQIYPEGNVSRQGLYGSYLKSCTHFGVKAINSASFGKAVRQKYPDIKTRRLGVRGASRYHYCGIIASNSAEAAILAQLAKEESDNSNAPTDETSPGEATSIEPPPEPESEAEPNSNIRPAFINDTQPATPTTARPKMPSHSGNGRRHAANKSKSLSISVPNNNNGYGEGEKTLNGGAATAIPGAGGAGLQPLAGFPSIEDALAFAGPGVDHGVAFSFWQQYATHCHSLLEAVRAYRFDQFELSIRTWWTGLDEPQKMLVQNPAVSQLIYRADAAVYADILEFLHAQILVNMPPQAFASLRGLADNMERIQTVALAAFEGLPFPSPKVELAARFGHLVTRHLGLCQLAQALTGIVSSASNMQEMAEAWDHIDFEAIKNQSALVSNCEHQLLEDCFAGFKHLLNNPGQVPIETFISWADQCFERCIAPSTSSHRQSSPRSLLIRWSFVTSQVMRDLTLRSAPTFGSFAIASTFFDEFLSFQVLRRVALQISAIVPTADPPRQIFPGGHHVGQPLLADGVYSTTTTSSEAVYSHSGANGDSHMKDHLEMTEAFALAQVGHYPSEYSNSLDHLAPSRPQDDHFAAGGAQMVYGSQYYGNQQDNLSLMESDVERFGDLRFDSSPSAASQASPEN